MSNERLQDSVVNILNKCNFISISETQTPKPCALRIIRSIYNKKQIFICHNNVFITYSINNSFLSVYRIKHKQFKNDKIENTGVYWLWCGIWTKCCHWKSRKLLRLHVSMCTVNRSGSAQWPLWFLQLWGPFVWDCVCGHTGIGHTLILSGTAIVSKAIRAVTSN